MSIIQHNMAAMNAFRHKNNNARGLAKNLEKLSSGYKVNRSADDASGLAISEKLRAQITGLDQAQDNIKDGISLIQTAEGAMQEIHDMLNRLIELSTKAANGTYSQQERDAIQDEVDAILKEITRIRNTTNFNGIPLLLGEDTVDTGPVASVKGGLPPWVNQPQLASKYMSGTYTTTETYTEADGSTTDYQIDHAAVYLDFSQLTAGNVSDLLQDDIGFYSTCCTCDSHYSINFVSGSTNSKETSGNHHIFKIGIDGVTTGEELINRIIAGTNSGNPNNHYTKLVKDPTNPNQLVVYDNRSTEPISSLSPAPSGGSWAAWTGLGSGGSAKPNPSSNRGIYGQGVAYEYKPSSTTGEDIGLQVGDMAAADHIVIDLPNMGLNKIGITGLSVKSIDEAFASLARVKDGVNYVSTERSRMGAYQNRLEHTYKYVTVMHENVQDTESTIRDTDMAEEIMKFTKNNILNQSSQAMLAQANQVPQGVLQLMQ